jgi:hypothetical protein
MATAPKKMTPEEAELARQQLAEYDASVLAAREAARSEKLTALQGLTSSAAFKEVQAKLVELSPTFLEYPDIYTRATNAGTALTQLADVK